MVTNSHYFSLFPTGREDTLWRQDSNNIAAAPYSDTMGKNCAVVTVARKFNGATS
jgi:hypothetical protein